MILMLLIEVHGFIVVCQIRQANTLGSDICADAPFRVQKFDSDMNLNAIPLHFYIHESECLGCGNELTDIKVRIKDASSASFGHLITLNTLPDSVVESLIIHRSPDDASFGMQAFDSSGCEVSAQATLVFKADESIFGTQYVDIGRRYWYFTLLIPGSELSAFEDVVDIEVCFSLNLYPDEYRYLRVFRSPHPLPGLPGWYRGDTHYHTLFTQNSAEYGLPLAASRLAAWSAGIQWITATDHSTDFDNYGQGMTANWERLGDEVAALNAGDSNFVIIRALEASLNNSEGKILHGLLYPSPSDPFGLRYFLDGGGDLSGTAWDTDKVLDSLNAGQGFMYAAHPFATEDLLGAVVNGKGWNIGDSLFPVNGESFPCGGTVAVNDPGLPSDIFSMQSHEVIKPGLTGGQIWNVRNTLSTSDEPDNPWNALQSGSVTAFSPLDTASGSYHLTRRNQNMDVVDFITAKGLQRKNTDPNALGWKFYIAAGTDAHGSFNYSNTDLTMGIYGAVNDNASGKLFSFAYCPQGMGENGEHVLSALKNGRVVLSDGPLLVAGISTNGADADAEILSGADTVLSYSGVSRFTWVTHAQTTPDFGDIATIRLTGITADTICHWFMPAVNGIQYHNMKELLDSLFGQIPVNEYFALRMELGTFKEYGSGWMVYGKTRDHFSCITNPVWIRVDAPDGISANEQMREAVIVPNPAASVFSVRNAGRQISGVLVRNLNGTLVAEYGFPAEEYNVSFLSPGMYIVEFQMEDASGFARLMVVR